MKNMMQLLIASAVLATLPALVLAQVSATSATSAKPASSAPSATQKADTSATNAVALSEGEIKKVNTDSGQLTIQHGPLANLNMPAMTMAFKVKSPAMLQQVKPGDKVRIVIEKVDGALTVTTLQKQP